jgi:photosystem II stability/assembly factor-like uncharacterized protein
MILQAKVSQPTWMAAFLNENFGLTGGFNGPGKAHYTLDGGTTWHKSESSGGCIHGIEIVDSKRVWVCGAMEGTGFTTPGGVRLSTDGGQTFGPKLNLATYAEECPMSFIDDRTGWVYQPETAGLNATSDGGLTWVKVPLPAAAKQIKAVAIRAAGQGFVLDKTGMVYATVNQGATWNQLPLPMKKYPGMRMFLAESATAAIRSLDKDNILVVMSLIGKKRPRIVAFRTHDGGVTWRDENAGSEMGSIFLSPDGRFITCNINDKVTVYRYHQQ